MSDNDAVLILFNIKLVPVPGLHPRWMLHPWSGYAFVNAGLEDDDLEAVKDEILAAAVAWA